MANWYGSKLTTGLCQAIVAAIPAHDVYIEPFPGGGGIMKRKPPAIRSIGTGPSRRATGSFECDCPAGLHHGCALRYPGAFPFQGRELACCDPPCVQPARRSERRCRFDCTDDGHAALPGLLKPLDCQVTVSGYPSRLYDTHLASWRPVGMQVSNQACTVTGKLWFSFAPDRVHWVSCAGRGFTHRRTVKRKAEGRGRRYKAMPRDGRLAVPASIMSVEAGERARRPMPSARPGPSVGTCPA